MPLIDLDLEDNQQMTPELSPDEAAASLAFGTNGLEHILTPQMMQEQGMEGENQPQEAQGEEMPQEPKKEPDQPKEESPDLTREFDEFKGEVKGMIESEVGQIKDIIKQALDEPD